MGWVDADQRIVAVKARMTELKALHLPLARPCSDCRFGPLNGTGAGICEHYAHWQITANVLDGKRRGKALVSTMKARSESGLCGPEGLLFEPYTRVGKIARLYAVNTHFRLWVSLLALMALISIAAAIGAAIAPK